MENTTIQPKTGVGSVAETNRLLGGNYFNQSGGQISNFTPKVPEVITPEVLAPVAPVSAPQVKPATQSANLLGFLDSTQEINKEARDFAEQNVKVDQKLRSETTDLKDTLRGLLEGRTSQSQAEATAFEEEGVNQSRKELDEIQNQIRSKSLAYRRQIERIQDAGGGLVSGQNIEAQRIEQEASRELADLSIIEQAKLSNYSTARDIADRKVRAELEQETNQIDALKFWYEENKADLTKQEDRQFNLMISERERLLNEQATEKKAVNDLVLDALQNGAPTSIVQQALKAGTQAEAMGLVGSYVGAQERELNQLKIEQLRSEINGSDTNPTSLVAKTLGIKPEEVELLPADVKNTATLTSILSSDIGQGTRTQIANVLGVIKASEDMASARQTEGFAGVSPFNALLNIKVPFTDIGLPFRQSAKSKGGVENEGYINAINLKVQQWASGAALTDRQTEQVERFTPNVNDTDEKVRTKLNNLVNFMYTQASGQLQSEGINYTPEKVNLFETYELIKQASPEQLQELRSQGLIN